MKLKVYKSILIFGTILISLNFAFSQTERENAVHLYDKGDYRAAVNSFEKVIKENPTDAEALTYLSLSLIKTGRLREAETALGKSLALDPNQVKARKALAQILLSQGKWDRAVGQAKYLISLDARDAEIYYVLGLASLRLGKLDAALENAEQSIKYDDKFAASYLLKAQALMNRKTEQTDYAAISEKLRATTESFDNYIQLTNDSTDLSFWRQQRENLKYFIDYYDEKQKTSVDLKDNKTPASTPLNILTKPRPAMTDQARNAGITGSINLMVAFPESGEVSRVLVLSNLGYGLDEEVIKTVKQMKFEPETQNGKPLTAVKMITYSFSVY